MAKSSKNVELEDIELEKPQDSPLSIEPPDLNGDWSNFFLLILINMMQGLLMGLSISFPIMFQSNKLVTYEEQAFFSIVLWPYSIKLLWAPIVDSLYIPWLGRRKSWFILIQYSIGAFLLYLASNIDEWLPEVGKPNFNALVLSFGIINFLAATLDITIDGWTLTMLKKRNVGHSSTCNGMGGTLGLLIGTIGPALLPSEDFCNTYLRMTYETGGLITIKGFLYFWSAVFTIVPTLVGIFKKEKNKFDVGCSNINIFQNYSLIWTILKLPSVRELAIALFTMKIGFAATESMSKLKLIDAGVPKDNIMMLTISMFIIKLFIPIVVSKYTSGPKPLSALLIVILPRLFWSFSHVVLIYYTPMFIEKNGVINVPMNYYVVLTLIYVIHEILAYTMQVFTVGFFFRISDPRFGGTYMSLLVTITSVGWSISKTLSLQMVDVLTFGKCSNDYQNDCSTIGLEQKCRKNNGDCDLIVNGFYLETILCMVVGFSWYFYFKNTVKNLQNKNSSEWMVKIDRLVEKKEIKV